MRIEIYIPDTDQATIEKINQLKQKRKLSAYIVDLLNNEPNALTEERVIELIKKYGNKNTTSEDGMESSIQSIFNALR